MRGFTNVVNIYASGMFFCSICKKKSCNVSGPFNAFPLSKLTLIEGWNQMCASQKDFLKIINVSMASDL